MNQCGNPDFLREEFQMQYVVFTYYSIKYRNLNMLESILIPCFQKRCSKEETSKTWQAKYVHKITFKLGSFFTSFLFVDLGPLKVLNGTKLT